MNTARVMATEMERLVPCGFSMLVPKGTHVVMLAPMRGGWQVRCFCGAAGPVMPDRESAAGAWRDLMLLGLALLGRGTA